jgi:hypothetical protein
MWERPMKLAAGFVGDGACSQPENDHLLLKTLKKSPISHLVKSLCLGLNARSSWNEESDSRTTCRLLLSITISNYVQNGQ